MQETDHPSRDRASPYSFQPGLPQFDPTASEQAASEKFEPAHPTEMKTEENQGEEVFDVDEELKAFSDLNVDDWDILEASHIPAVNLSHKSWKRAIFRPRNPYTASKPASQRVSVPGLT